MYKITRTKKGLLPLSAYEEISAFKLFMLDVGLMHTLAKIPMQALLQGDALFTDFKSLSTFVKDNKGLHGIRFSMSLYRKQDWMTNVPLHSICTYLQ